jgi:hypothetical protein
MSTVGGLLSRFQDAWVDGTSVPVGGRAGPSDRPPAPKPDETTPCRPLGPGGRGVSRLDMADASHVRSSTPRPTSTAPPRLPSPTRRTVPSRPGDIISAKGDGPTGKPARPRGLITPTFSRERKHTIGSRSRPRREPVAHTAPTAPSRTTGPLTLPELRDRRHSVEWASPLPYLAESAPESDSLSEPCISRCWPRWPHHRRGSPASGRPPG